jgi:hypothetical protein
MASRTTMHGRRVRRGKRMNPGKGWRLYPSKTSKRVFKASLLHAFDIKDGQRLALFRVLEAPD